MGSTNSNVNNSLLAYMGRGIKAIWNVPVLGPLVLGMVTGHIVGFLIQLLVP